MAKKAVKAPPTPKPKKPTAKQLREEEARKLAQASPSSASNPYLNRFNQPGEGNFPARAPSVGQRFSVNPNQVNPGRLAQLQGVSAGQSFDSNLRDGAGNIIVDSQGQPLPSFINPRSDFLAQTSQPGYGAGPISALQGPSVYANRATQFTPAQIYDIAMEVENAERRDQAMRDARAIDTLNQGLAGARGQYDRADALLADQSSNGIADMERARQDITSSEATGRADIERGRDAGVGRYDAALANIDNSRRYVGQLGAQELSRIAEQEAQIAASGRAELSRRGLGASTLLNDVSFGASRFGADARLGVADMRARNMIDLDRASAGINAGAGDMVYNAGTSLAALSERAGAGRADISRGSAALNADLSSQRANLAAQRAGLEMTGAGVISDIGRQQYRSNVPNLMASMYQPPAPRQRSQNPWSAVAGSIVGSIGGALFGGIGSGIGSAAGNWFGNLGSTRRQPTQWRIT